MDGDQDIAAGAVPGAKRAAVRKLFHELGIPSHELPLEKFKYLTRLHYCAADTGAINCCMQHVQLVQNEYAAEVVAKVSKN